MRGLIIKDLMVMKKTLLIYAVISVIYGWMDIRQETPGMMFAMLLIISAMVPVSSISYDERCNWDKLANITPLSRGEIVMSKYLLALVLTAFSSAFVFVVYLVAGNMSVTENLALTYVMALMSMVYQALLLPVIIKFGSERGRTVMMFILFAPVVVVMGVMKMDLPFVHTVGVFLDNNQNLIPFVMTVAVAVIYVASVMLSINIYKKKDL